VDRWCRLAAPVRRSFALLFMVSSGSAACAEILGFDETRELEAATGGGGSASYSAEVRADEPILYFRLEDTASPIINEMGDALRGTGMGALAYATPAKIGNGLGFSHDATAGTAVVVSDALDFSGHAPMSVECWVRVDQSSPFQHLVSKRFGDGANGWSLSIEPTKGLRYSRANSSSSQPYHHAEIRDFPISELFHVVATYNGSVSTIYRDGNVAEAQPGRTELPDTSEPLRLGAGETGSHFGGVLDEVAIYDHVLDEDRIQAHFRARSP
jgi:hypothetical protein